MRRDHLGPAPRSIRLRHEPELSRAALLDERPLQFRHRAEHLQGKASLWRRGVDRIGERFEMRPLGVAREKSPPTGGF
jgi:hypothetical protein